MKLYSGLILYFTLFSFLLFAQSNSDIDILQKHYESFEYSAVISESDNLLLDKTKFSDETLIKIYTLKAASYYTVGDQKNSRKTFIELLKVDNKYKLNSATYSPKLITFFNDVNKEFLDILELNSEQNISPKEVESTNRIQQPIISNTEFNTALAKSIVMPGWGHLHLNNNTKGWILTSAGSITLGSMVYFIFDANSKEVDYLAETNSQLIQQNYDKYNKSYKIRNSLIAVYAIIWLYSQIDILFFSNELGSKNISAEIYNKFQPTESNKITLSLKFPL